MGRRLAAAIFDTLWQLLFAVPERRGRISIDDREDE